MSKYNSEQWWSHITTLADSFVQYINKQTSNDENGVILRKKSLEQVKNNYYKNLRTFKRKFYGKKNADTRKLDIHKIIALYIKSFLEVSPFYIYNRKPGSQKKFKLIQLYPNEYFSLELMKLILIAWNETKTVIFMEPKERSWFIGLLNHFRLDTAKLDILSLASIIYYIENKYLCPKKDPAD